jgi:hypothetical protein
MTIRTYTELCLHDSLEDRFEYLALHEPAGASTFGFDRWMNQQFYHSREWRMARDEVIVRDEGFDLGHRETPVMGAHVIHHMNPITPEDLETGSDNLLDPEFLITCALRTHNAVHFGDKKLLPQPYVERQPGDTLLWSR